MEIANHLILVGGLLFIVSILASILSPRLGVPLLLVFLIVGMLAGEEGPGGLQFHDYALANLAGTAALAVVLFDGGMRTRMTTFRVGLRPAVALASVGVLLTTLVVGGFAAWCLDLSLAEGLLIGAIVGSTDAAAVFSLLHTNAVHLNERVTSALEIESGTNDPMAVFLTLGLLQYLQSPADYHWYEGLIFWVEQMGLGVLFGIFGGRALAWALNRLNLSDSLYPLMALFSGLFIFGLTSTLHGSGFLAVYLAGVVLGNRKVRAFGGIRRFHDGVAWASQIGMFVILGLLVTPSKMLPLAIPGVLISLVLIVIARPLAVALSLAPFRFPWQEQAYIAWVGLRGSVPIVLATFPWLAGIENASVVFNIAFFIVLVSLVVQGWSVAPVARLLGLQMPATTAMVHRSDFDLPGTRGYEIVSYQIGETSPLIGLKSKDLPIIDTSRIVCVARRGKVISYREWGALRSGDHIALLASQEELPELDEVFRADGGHVKLKSKTAKPRKEASAEARYFGEFGIDLRAPATALSDAYGLDLPESAKHRSVVEFFTSVIPRPVVGDRLRLGEMELVVKKMEGDKVTEIGLRLPH